MHIWIFNPLANRFKPYSILRSKTILELIFIRPNGIKDSRKLNLSLSRFGCEKILFVSCKFTNFFYEKLIKSWTNLGKFVAGRTFFIYFLQFGELYDAINSVSAKRFSTVQSCNWQIYRRKIFSNLLFSFPPLFFFSVRL